MTWGWTAAGCRCFLDSHLNNRTTSPTRLTVWWRRVEFTLLRVLALTQSQHSAVLQNASTIFIIIYVHLCHRFTVMDSLSRVTHLTVNNFLVKYYKYYRVDEMLQFLSENNILQQVIKLKPLGTVIDQYMTCILCFFSHRLREWYYTWFHWLPAF